MLRRRATANDVKENLNFKVGCETKMETVDNAVVLDIAVALIYHLTSLIASGLPMPAPRGSLDGPNLRKIVC